MSLVDRIVEEQSLLKMKPATKEQIKEAETCLGLRFATEYCEYLEAFGAATFLNFELTGICKSERLNVVDATNRARNRYPQIPKDYYVVEEIGVDRVVIVQNHSGTVFQYGPIDRAKKINSSLEEYLFSI